MIWNENRTYCPFSERGRLVSVGSEIKEKRLHLGLTQKEFADALGMNKTGDRTLRRWENGETKPSAIEYNSIMHFAETIPFEDLNKKPAFTFIDLFAGIGGIRIPFQELGGKCVFSSEWDKFAQKTYRANFGETPQGDITEIETDAIPDFDVLIAGFPCQPFSQAGLRKGFADTRGTLFFEIERIIKDKKPRAFLLENVKQLRTHDKGRTFATIIRHLEDLNYYVNAAVLRAADFGVAQNRERIYIVGLSKEHFNIDKDYNFSFPLPTHEDTCLGDLLESNVSDKYTLSDALWEGHQRRKLEHQKKGNGFGYSLFNQDSKYTNTISARYYKDGSEILIEQGDGKNPRKLTPRECARLQGFPEEFIITVSDTQAYRQFGNSVAVPVVRAVAKRIIEDLTELNNN